MKLIPLMAVSAVLGGGLGAALAYVSIGPEPAPVAMQELAHKASQSGGVATTGPKVNRAKPKARVDDPTFEFDSMQRGTSMSHIFHVFNDGDAPLMLTTGETTCKCTEFVTGSGPIAPGESAPVKLEWAAKVGAGPFRQSAQLHTTDPTQPVIDLSVSGEVIEATGLVPPDFNLGRISAKETRETSVVLMSFDQEDLKVAAKAPKRESATSVDGEGDQATLEPYKVKVVELDPADFPDKRAKAAVRVELKAGPGLPVGVIYDWVTLETNLPSAERMQVPIFGRVEGDLSIHGFGWSADSGVLALGMVKSAKGKKAKLRISIKNPDAASAKLIVAKVDPPELEVTLGEPKPIREGVVHVPVTIEVPAGLQPMVRLQTGLKPDGTYQHPEGEIRLKSNLPSTPELDIRVRFAVQGGGR